MHVNRGLVFWGVALIGLGVLWTFRNTAAKIPTRGQHNDADIHG